MQAYRDVTQDGQQDVDEEVRIASTLEEYTERREEDGEDDLDDVAVVPVSKPPCNPSSTKARSLPCGERHDGGKCLS